MKTLTAALIFGLSLSAFAEGIYECHLKTGRNGAHAPEVGAALVVTHENILFSSASEDHIFATQTRALKSHRGNNWIEFALNKDDITTSLRADTNESMDKITLESMRGQTLVNVKTYYCFKTH